MKRDIELFLVSGFLGSGKTTFLRHVLTQMSGYRVGVIVNEFGSVGIDGPILKKGDLKLVEINNGSIFCACLKGGFVKTLVAFLEQPVDFLFVEASGLADPSSMENFLKQMDPYLDKKPEVTRRYRYRGGICIVDAIHFIQFCKVFSPVQNQVRKSHFVILNKVDDVEEDKKQDVLEMIELLNPEAFVYCTNYGVVPVSVLEEKVEIGYEDDTSSNTPWNRPVTYVIDMPPMNSIEQVKNFCKCISHFTIRMKGFFPMCDGWGHIDCVGNDIVVRRIEEKPIETSNFQLVIICKNKFRIKEELTIAWRNIIGTPLQIREG